MFSDNENLKNSIEPINKNDGKVIYAPYVFIDSQTLTEGDMLIVKERWVHPISSVPLKYKINLEQHD